MFIESIIKIDAGEGISLGKHKAYAGITSGCFSPRVEDGLKNLLRVRICAAGAFPIRLIRNLGELALSAFIAPQNPLVALGKIVRHSEIRD
jgi:hypothetical protein